MYYIYLCTYHDNKKNTTEETPYCSRQKAASQGCVLAFEKHPFTVDKPEENVKFTLRMTNRMQTAAVFTSHKTKTRYVLW